MALLPFPPYFIEFNINLNELFISSENKTYKMNFDYEKSDKN